MLSTFKIQKLNITLMSITFVPVRDVTEKFMKLLNTPFFKDNDNLLNPLVHYFEDFWICCPNAIVPNDVI